MDNNKKIEFIKNWVKNKNNRQRETINHYSRVLAHEKNLEAFNIFIDGLNDKDDLWREVCLTQIGYHYKPLDKNLINKIKDILLNDNTEFLRLAASHVLSANISEPDPVFIEAIKKSKDIDVKINCLKEYLKKSKVEKSEIKNEIDSILKKNVTLSNDYLHKLLKKYKLLV